MRIILLLVFIIILCCGGGKGPSIIKENTPIKVIDLLAPPKSEITNLSDIATNVEYIPLQTSENSLIKYISDMKVRENKIYIKTNNELLCFDSTGHYLHKFSKVGRGPGEYRFINDFDVNSKGDVLMILSYDNILVYNIKGDEFFFNNSLNIKSDVKNQISNVDFIPGQNNILISYLCNGNEPLRNLLINFNEDTLNARPNYYKWINKLTAGAGPYENLDFISNNSLHFKNWHSDTVFIIDQYNKIMPYLILNANGKQVTPDVLSDFSSKGYASIMTSGDPTLSYLVITHIIEVPRYLIYSYRYMKIYHYEIYDKQANRKFGFDAKAFLEDDITGGVNFEPKLCCDGKLYTWIDALALKKHISEDNFKKSIVKNPEKKKALEKLADSLNETDNPVLIVVTPKQ